VKPQRRVRLTKKDKQLLRRLESRQCTIAELKLASADPWLPQHVHDRIVDWLRVIEKPESHGG
jgi:hypothetical protein